MSTAKSQSSTHIHRNKQTIVLSDSTVYKYSVHGTVSLNGINMESFLFKFAVKKISASILFFIFFFFFIYLFIYLFLLFIFFIFLFFLFYFYFFFFFFGR